MEIDIRTGQPTTVEAVRFSDNRVVKVDANAFVVANNTGATQLNIPKAQVDDLIAALQAAKKLLG